MKIGKFAIKYKFFVLAFAMAIMMLGTYSKSTLQVQLSPDTNPPMATVIAQYIGASAQDVVEEVVEPMEEEFGKLEGIDGVKSTSQDNLAVLQLEFNYGIDIDKAAIDVQNSISRIKNNLPSRLDEPKVLKFSTSDKPIATLSLSSDSMSMEKIREMAEEEIAYKLQLVDGVAAISIFGGYNSEVQVQIDKNKSDAYNISIQHVSNVLTQNNIKAPGGKVNEINGDILIRMEEGLSNEEEILNLRIPLEDGNFIYMRDVAKVEYTYGELESSYRFNGKNSIALMVTKSSDANTIEVVQEVKNKLDDLMKEYPFIDFHIAQDDSIFTEQMVDNMTSSVVQSIILTIIVIMLFISVVNQSLVVSISMPLVFLMTLGLMKLSGLKLDLVTLSALILSIGFVVDASIVVVENIMTHHSEYSKDIVTATMDAVSEISIPTITGAVTTLVVLFPLLFIKGFVGVMFKPLSLTLIFAISSSIVVALVIIPLFAVIFNDFKLKKIGKIVSVLSVPFNKFMDLVLEGYIKSLRFSLNNKGKVYIVVLLLMILSVRFFVSNGIEMLPKFDSGVSYITIEMMSGSDLDKTEEAVANIEKYLSKEENVVSYDTQIGFEKDNNSLGDFGVMGTNQAQVTINLNTRKEREETIWEFQERLRGYVAQIPEINNFVVKEQGGTAVSGSSAPLVIRISGDNQEILYSLAESLEDKVKQVEGTTNIYKSFHFDNKQAVINLNHGRLQELGLNSANVSQQLLNSVEGIKNSYLEREDTKKLDISIQYGTGQTKSMEDLMNTNIDTSMGIKVPLRELAIITMEHRANIITKYNMEYTIEILGYTDNRAFSHVVQDINEIIDNFSVPRGYSISMVGEQEELGNSMKDMVFSLVLAIIFVYLILVPQFKSFLDPITVMSAIPLVIIGIAPALVLTGKYISMPVLLGFILLAGTVVNNSILLIDFVKNYKRGENTLEESLILAVKSRFRPIMMTALSDVAGMLPLAMQLALGAERFSPLAITVVGGILAATFLTMIMIPVIYGSFEEINRKLVPRGKSFAVED